MATDIPRAMLAVMRITSHVGRAKVTASIGHVTACARKANMLQRIRARATARAGLSPRLVGFGRPAATTKG